MGNDNTNSTEKDNFILTWSSGYKEITDKPTYAINNSLTLHFVPTTIKNVNMTSQYLMSWLYYLW